MNNTVGFNFYQNAGMVGENIRRFGGHRAEGPEGSGRPPKDDDRIKEKKTEGTDGVFNGVELSDGAKKILDELKEKYGENTDFFVANYSSEEEAQEYLSRGTKQYSVLIEPELLEEMARDNEAKEKYMGIIEEGTKQLDNIKEQLKEAGKDGDVKNIGFSVDRDGNVNFFAQLEQNAKARSEWIEEQRKERRAERKAEEESRERKRLEDRKDPRDFKDFERNQVKKADIKASTAEELFDKIVNFDWDSVKSEQKLTVGSKVDFSA